MSESRTNLDFSTLLRALDDAKGAETSNPFFEWRGGTPDSHGVIQMPWCAYTPVMDGLWARVRSLGLGNAFPDHVAWMTPYTQAPHDWIEAASLQEIDRFFYVLDRMDRFNDGLWAEMVTGGVFARLLRRYQVLQTQGKT